MKLGSIGSTTETSRSPVQALLNIERETTDRNVFIVVSDLIRTAQDPRAPDDVAEDWECSQTISADHIIDPPLVVLPLNS